MTTGSPPVRRAITALVLGPLAFLAAIVGLSAVVTARTRQDPEAVQAQVTGQIPALLLITQLLLVAVLAWAVRRDRVSLRDLGWSLRSPRSSGVDIGLGVAVGAAIAGAYLWWLNPLMTHLQRTVGDIVPAGQLLPSLGTALVPFFIANVVLAPVVEETFYRGYALRQLGRRWGTPVAFVVTCVLFGTLHWAGGLWYMLLTGVLAGGAFGALRLRRGTLLAAFTAHLTLNTIEFIAVATGS